jgi:hypothetical protein
MFLTFAPSGYSIVETPEGMANEFQFDVFLSHSGKDKWLVRTSLRTTVSPTRAELFARFKDDTGQGEKILASNLYEYLHDQGVQFQIEPQSASGRIDLVSAQSGKDRLVADAKLFNPGRGQDRGYITKGFRQVYEYTKDYNEPFGYLVVFKTCEQDLAIPTQHQESAVPFITHNNKTIFVVLIDIFDYPESASKRGKLQAYEITPAQFVESLA